MRILMITRKIDRDDAGAGFAYGWIKKLSERVEGVKAICLHRGNIVGLENVGIYSLGKEKISSRSVFLRRLVYVFRFFKYIWRLRNDYDAVFVHMHVVYVLLGGFFWRAWGKKIGLWYAHVKTSFWAKLASYFVHYVFTPSGESFAFAPKKLRKVGHGIDTDFFRPAGDKIQKQDSGVPSLLGGELQQAEESRMFEKIKQKKQIISLGRISPVKEYDTLVEAIDILVNNHQITNFCVKMVGSPVKESDFEYLDRLREKIKSYKIDQYFDWFGEKANKDVPLLYQQADIFVNMQQGGGFGKAVLEAMASGLTCVICSPVYKDILGQYVADTIFEFRNPADMAQKLKVVLGWDEQKVNSYGKLVRDFVVKNHNLDNLMDKIISTYE